MARIAAESEESIRKKGYQDPPHSAQPTNAEILADAAYHAARESGAAAIVVFTSTRIERAPGLALPSAGEHLRRDAARHHRAPAFGELRRDAPCWRPTFRAPTRCSRRWTG